MTRTFKVGGQWITKGLFLEQSYMDPSLCLYTLKDEDTKGLISLYRAYMKEEDLTEYTFANTYFAGWDHWQAVCEAPWFKSHIEKWRKEMEIKVKSEALMALRTEAASAGKNAFVANKYLVEKGWQDKPVGPGRGRPKKTQEDLELTQKELKEAFERMSIQ